VLLTFGRFSPIERAEEAVLRERECRACLRGISNHCVDRLRNPETKAIHNLEQPGDEE
jgi:hypothetical protein